jgi:nicotinamidase-related amidase
VLLSHLCDSRADAIVITGAETDVCVLAAVLGAVDFGYRVVVAEDASAVRPTPRQQKERECPKTRNLAKECQARGWPNPSSGNVSKPV